MAPIMKEAKVDVRVTQALKDRIEAAATKAAMAPADWVRAVLALAANQGAFAPKEGRRHGKPKTSRKPPGA